MQLPDGIVAVVKSDCPTCRLVAPVLVDLAATVISEDDDAGLEASYRNQIVTVPTLLRVEDGRETARIEGWSRPQWEAFTGVGGLSSAVSPSFAGVALADDRICATVPVLLRSMVTALSDVGPGSSNNSPTPSLNLGKGSASK